MKIALMIVAMIAMVAFMVFEAFEAGRYYQSQQPLTYMEKRNIAIDYICNPARKWPGRRLYCGKVEGPY